MDGSRGYEKEAPYDKILVSACLQENNIPTAWKKQLKVGGRIVCPIGNSIQLFIKKSENEFEKFEYPGFVFVPLTCDNVVSCGKNKRFNIKQLII